jgi:hypothetical protein
MERADPVQMPLSRNAVSTPSKLSSKVEIDEVCAQFKWLRKIDVAGNE